MIPAPTPVAGSVPFDNSTNGFTSTDVQAAIEEAKNTSASGINRKTIEASESLTIGLDYESIIQKVIDIQGALDVQGILTVI